VASYILICTDVNRIPSEIAAVTGNFPVARNPRERSGFFVSHLVVRDSLTIKFHYATAFQAGLFEDAEVGQENKKT
jgi:hypothetical protein